MKKTLLLLLLVVAGRATAQQPSQSEIQRWERQAQAVTITRDDWGIAHVKGKTDADAVFGMIYAQAEDDFNRVETNYLNALGRLAEFEGESAIYSDLRMKLFIQPDSLKALYAVSPPWLKLLMNAWADGLNYYLHTHPRVTPKVIAHYEPWMALSFSEGSIGGDIERINLGSLEAFYGGNPAGDVVGSIEPFYREPTGSNGIAIAPSNTKNHHALLLINPHTSFFFRSELQMTSDEGLNAYGAVTWGQIFVYQGFNDDAGWMHTSSGVDNIDEYLETVTRNGDRLFYAYGNEQRPVTVRTVTVPYKTANGMASKQFTVYRTHHGPIVREADGKWVSVRLMQDPMHALEQSYLRTKAHDLASYRETMELHTNSSNNTIYADGSGNIAYFHSNFIPRRDTSFDWTQPVPGSNPATEWNGVLSIDETPNVFNPSVGWLYNSNNWPWSAAGPDSPRREDYPAYVERGSEESPRGEHALLLLTHRHDLTVESLIDLAYDSYLPWFAHHIPELLGAYDAMAAGDSLKLRLAEPIAVLRDWDDRWGVNSVATSLGVFWGEYAARHIDHATPQELIADFAHAVDRLTADFGSWKTPWGTINRFQRLTGDIVQPFNDAAPSIPVGFTSSRWGSLASFGARPYPGTKKWYGTSGNSFVAVVEFGDTIRARAITAGGESGHPESPHFNDEAERYATGNLREVYFYPRQLIGHTERVYHPGR